MGLTLIAIAIMALGGVYTYNRHKARGSVRLLLTRCEEALGCYDSSFFSAGVSLYPLDFRQFKKRGWWLAATYLLALLAGVGFLFILLSADPPA